MTNEHSADDVARRRSNASILIWLGAIAFFVFLKYRGEIGVYQSFHRWMADQGAVDWVRHSDQEVLTLLFGLALWVLMRSVGKGTTQGFLSDIGLHRGLVKGVAVGVFMCLPLLAFGVAQGLMQEGITFFKPEMIRLGFTGPFAEEWLFRGVLVLAMVRLVGTRFWTAAILGAVLFGVVHMQWTAEGILKTWPAFLVTGAGGVWYAWLARQWGRNLYVPITAHMLMNLAAPWYGGTDFAMGNLYFEFGRAATITLGTVMTINPGLVKMAWARGEKNNG